jgi:hypothetical protein
MNLLDNVVVIGSGLSSIGAIKALVKEGIKPTVLDLGNTLESNKKELIQNLSSQNPINWKTKDRESLIKDICVAKEKSSIPKKLVFGSDFFYGKSSKNAPVQSDGSTPPFSYAKGGLSAGWGAAILPPSKYDIKDWPIDIDEFHKYCKIVLKDLPYSSSDDGLSLSFPQMNDKSNRLKLSSRATYILNKLKSNVQLKKDDTVYGQARLLVNSTDDSSACQYCGECMSGCVYKSIYKSDDEIIQLHKDGKIDYIDNCLVDKLIEKDEKVLVEYFDENKVKMVKEFNKVFLGAGAVNSSRIILNSLENFDTTLEVKTRGGYVVPVFSFNKLKIDWPSVNTQPSLFIEFRGEGLQHWVHTQVSSDNELLLKMLGLRNKSKGLIAKIKEYIAEHTYLLLVNYHSEHSGTYELKLEKDDNNNILQTKHKKDSPQFKVLVASWWKLFKILFKIGSIPMYPFAKLNSGSYHVGGTMPMKENPKELETDILGVVKGMKNVHIVDTSTFPSLPGTTIVLMMMANAYRIVDKVFKKEVR